MLINLSWTDHIDTLATKLGIIGVRQMKCICGPEIAKTDYYLLVGSHQVWHYSLARNLRLI